MKVLWWSGTFWPNVGGLEVITAHLMRSLSERGHEITVVTQLRGEEGSGPDTIGDVPVHRFRFFEALERGDPVEISRIGKRLEAIFEDVEPRLVHLHTLSPQDFFCQRLLDASTLPLIVTMHACLHADPELGPDSLVGRLLGRADRVVCCSDSLDDHMRILRPDLGDRSAVILNSLPFSGIAATPVPVDPPVIACVGRLDRDKGFDLALSAFASLSDRYPEARMVIAGDGPERDVLRDLTDDLGITGPVEFTGWIHPERVSDLLDSSTMVLMPSLTEGLPLVAIQAAQRGRPVIAARVGGLPEIVVDGLTGLIVPPANSDALAGAITYLLDDPVTAAGFGTAAARHVADRFAWSDFVDAYERLYHQVIQEREHV